jgi:glycerol-3-phosphate dehydrogenase
MSSERSRLLAALDEGTFDVLVVGAGINGAVTAASLAARGARVALIDRGDFAGFTSQQSSNLAWGGIKYMESFELGLVRKLCKSRNHLIESYPSTVREIRFLATHERGFRHGLWKLVLGTWLYWLIGGFFTRRPRRLSTSELASTEPLLDASICDGGFEYSDAYLHDNDARFVWGFVRRAIDEGCVALNYAESLGARREGDVWVTEVRDQVSGAVRIVRARVLVNAAGPFVDRHNTLTRTKTSTRHAFSKGIHLLVDRLTPHDRVLAFFADDGRPFFVIPMGPRSCLGTTDTPVDDPDTEVTDEDRRFVLENVNKRLKLARPLDERDIIAERCGVRPLAVSGATNGGDWMSMSRKHVIEVDTSSAQVSIFGGKLTDCINVGEEMCREVSRLGVALPDADRRWYGEPSADERDRFLRAAAELDLDGMTSPHSSEKLTTRLWRRYGLDAFKLLERIREDRSAAEVLIERAEYLRCEIELAAQKEMVVKLEDFLRRRSKIALVMRREDLERSSGLVEACRLLFGAGADAALAEWRGSDHDAPLPPRPRGADLASAALSG